MLMEVFGAVSEVVVKLATVITEVSEPRFDMVVSPATSEPVPSIVPELTIANVLLNVAAPFTVMRF